MINLWKKAHNSIHFSSVPFHHLCTSRWECRGKNAKEWMREWVRRRRIPINLHQRILDNRMDVDGPKLEEHKKEHIEYHLDTSCILYVYMYVYMLCSLFSRLSRAYNRRKKNLEKKQQQQLMHDTKYLNLMLTRVHIDKNKTLAKCFLFAYLKCCDSL